MITKTKSLYPIILGALAIIAMPIIFCAIIGRMTESDELLNEIILLGLSLQTLLNIIAYLSSLPLIRKLGLPFTSFRMIGHGVTGVLVFVALFVVLSQSRGLFAASIPGQLLLMFSTALAAFLLSTLLQFLAQTVISRYDWR